MADDPIRLRKLPGHRRGVINSASAWLASDHILLVRSQRFKEEYKRYYFRDIQAIAIARAGRFHVSSRVLFVIALWTVALLMSFVFPFMTVWVWVSAIVLGGAWLFISAERSCFCRIYTAVSSDPLPSVYRTWTARKFLRIVEARIREVQGELDAGWMEAVAQRAVGPETVRDEANMAELPSTGQASRTGKARTLASDLFLAAMLFQAGADVLALRNRSAMLTWIISGLVIAQIVAAIFLFVDRSRGRLRSSIHKLAIAKLIWVTLLSGTTDIAKAQGVSLMEAGMKLAPANDVLRGIDASLSAAFVAVGLLMMYRPESQKPTSMFGS